MGKNLRQNIPVTAVVYRDQDFVNPVATLTGAIAFPNPTPQLGTHTVTVGSIGIPITRITGQYTVKIFTTLDIDQDVMNDTLTSRFFIS